MGPAQGQPAADDDEQWKEFLAQAQAEKTKQRSPLREAAGLGNAAEVKKLLRQGVDLEALDEEGLSPLLAACREGHDAIVELLLKQGASVTAVDKENWTCLHWACEKGRNKVVAMLEKKV